jgi:2Fe-2S ferredoxin
MALITFIEPNGTGHRTEIPNNGSLMQGAIHQNIPGIVAECGGSCVCATCHVYISPEWVDRIDPPSANELEMLECTNAERQTGSRLSCQIKVTEALSGLVVMLPATQ